MNNEQLEALLEEALQSVQENIPSMVQSFQEGTNTLFPSFPSFPHLDVSNQVQRPSVSILPDPVPPVEHEIPIPIIDMSSNNVEQSISYDVNTPTVNTPQPPSNDSDNIYNINMFHFATEYMDNMRLYQQNMGSIIQSLDVSRGRTRNRSNPRRDLRSNINNRRNPNQISMEFVTAPFPFFTPDTPSLPTLQQYTDATETFTYNSSTVSRVNSITCPITLEDFQHGELLCEIKHCHHVFKEASLRNWFVRNAHCPVCRYDIRTYVTGAT